MRWLDWSRAPVALEAAGSTLCSYLYISDARRQKTASCAKYLFRLPRAPRTCPNVVAFCEGQTLVGTRLEAPTHQVTHLLHAWSQGDKNALARLMPLVYADLHRLARRCMAQERPDHTLQATALVHESYLRLLDAAQPRWQDRAQFLAVCARMMRRILVDWARSRQRLKRQSDLPPLYLQEALAGMGRRGADLVILDDALTALATVDLRRSQIVELRFFGGLTVKETAEVLKISEDTVLRDWNLAKSWLRRELSKGQSRGT